MDKHVLGHARAEPHSPIGVPRGKGKRVRGKERASSTDIGRRSTVVESHPRGPQRGNHHVRSCSQVLT